MCLHLSVNESVRLEMRQSGAQFEAANAPPVL